MKKQRPANKGCFGPIAFILISIILLIKFPAAGDFIAKVINDANVFFIVRIFLSVLAFKLTNLAKFIWILVFKFSRAYSKILFKCSGIGRIITKSIFMCYFSCCYVFM